MKKISAILMILILGGCSSGKFPLYKCIDGKLYQLMSSNSGVYTDISETKLDGTKNTLGDCINGRIKEIPEIQIEKVL